MGQAKGAEADERRVEVMEGMGVLGQGRPLNDNIYVQWIKIEFYCSISRART
jgi:hypothetical protein